MRCRLQLLGSLVLLLLVSCNSKKSVQFLVHHAVIYTADSAFSQQSAMAIDGGKIVAIGSDSLILSQYTAKEVLDAGGKPIFPGFIDAHCHFTGYATDMWKCELAGTGSFEEIIQLLQDYAKQAPTPWIYGRGWDQNDWPNKEFPGKEQLDRLFPNQPVFLKRIDGHAALVNQFALNMAGITATTKISGGEVVLKNGAPTGLLIDNAMDIVEKLVPALADSLAVKYYLRAQDTCFRYGLTGVHDCGVSEKTIELVDQAQQAGLLQMKIYCLLTDSAQYYNRWVKKGPYKTPNLHVGGFKVYADGALGSRGACLLAAYADKPNWKGFLLTDTQRLRDITQTLANSQLQLCTHAIGDSGNRVVLEMYGDVLKGKNDRRWRIEHAQVVQPADLALFQQFQIIPSVQPTHATSDMYWAEKRLGEERIQHAYAYQSLLKLNGWMPLGTDFPVEGIDPLRTFYAAVVRQDAKGWPDGGFQPEQALSRKEALWGMTLWAARSAFEEKEKGSLEVGKSADFVLLNQDIMTCKAVSLLQTKVMATYLNGKKVF